MAAFGDSHSSTLWGSALQPTPWFHAGRLSPASTPGASRLESKTNTDSQSCLDRVSVPQAERQDHRQPLPGAPFPEGCQAESGEIPLRALFCSVLLASGATRIKKQPALSSNAVLLGSWTLL